MNFIGLVFAIATGIVRDRQSRRAVLFGVVLAAMLMLFVGMVFIAAPLAANPWIFLLYWGICILLTFFSMLLAVHDLLTLTREARRERARLKAELFSQEDQDKEKRE